MPATATAPSAPLGVVILRHITRALTYPIYPLLVTIIFCDKSTQLTLTLGYENSGSRKVSTTIMQKSNATH